MEKKPKPGDSDHDQRIELSSEIGSKNHRFGFGFSAKWRLPKGGWVALVLVVAILATGITLVVRSIVERW